MTNASISRSPDRINDARWRSVGTDLAFWTVVGAVVAALSGPLGEMWGVPRIDLMAGGLSVPSRVGWCWVAAFPTC
jgi:hypothetical protein